MEERDDVDISPAIQRRELSLDPCRLDRVLWNVGVERDEIRIPETECIGRITDQAMRRALRRNQPRVHVEVVAEPLDTARIVEILGASDIMVTDAQQVRNPGR